MPGLQDLAVRLSELLDIPQKDALQLALGVQPVLLVESIVGLPSSRVTGLAGAPGFGSDTQAAVAGRTAEIQLLNPVDSGIEIHVDRYMAFVDAASTVQLRDHSTALASLTAGTWRDFRRPGQPAGELRAGNPVAVDGTLIGTVSEAALVSVTVDLHPTILDEGQGLIVATGTQNVGLTCFWFWREVR